MRRWIATVGQQMYNALPDPLAALVSETSYRFSSRPHRTRGTGVDNGRRLPRGTVVFSIDFELAWAWRFARVGAAQCVERGLHERAMVPRVLAALAGNGIPATWATVGHLFLEHCTRSAHGHPHEEIPRCDHFLSPRWSFTDGDWFQHDPCTDVRQDPAWYAPDLIEAIVASPAGHEMGCHTFSHMGFGRYCPPEVARAEIAQSRHAMRRFGLEPRSFVFPGNDPGNFEVLTAEGIRAVRWYPVPGNELGIPLGRPDGLWALPTSLAVESRPDRTMCAVRLRRLKSYLDVALRERLMMHVWFHPSFQPAHLELVLVPFLRHCADLRDRGLLDIKTMGSVAEAMEHRADGTRSGIA